MFCLFFFVSYWIARSLFFVARTVESEYFFLQSVTGIHVYVPLYILFNDRSMMMTRKMLLCVCCFSIINALSVDFYFVTTRLIGWILEWMSFTSEKFWMITERWKQKLGENVNVNRTFDSRNGFDNTKPLERECLHKMKWTVHNIRLIFREVWVKYANIRDGA